MKYEVRDENGDLMRVFHYREEAEHWVSLREGWTVKAKRQPKPPKLDLSSLPEAPF